MARGESQHQQVKDSLDVNVDVLQAELFTFGVPRGAFQRVCLDRVCVLLPRCGHQPPPALQGNENDNLSMQHAHCH